MYRCFDPVKMLNKYTGEWLWVPCRECDACHKARANELSNRIEREMLDPSNRSCYFITLDYRPEDLPAYEFDMEAGEWYSNRSEHWDRFQPIDYVPHYYRPENAVVEQSFGHLCYPDVLKWITNMRATFHRRFGRDRSETENLIFGNYGKEDLQFRYFLCGEYGPTTFRPHYHVLLWFKRSFTAEQERYISQVVSKSWKYGRVDFQAVHNRGIKNYLSSYVTSTVGLPPVLQTKSLRPFVIFSKNPVIGAYKVDYEEVQKILNTGAVDRVKWNDKTKSFDDDVLSPSFFRRYFPKCCGFNYETYQHKLRVYSYVFNYFKDEGITHTLQEAEDLKLVDVPFPIKRNFDPFDEKEYNEWSYLDKYASMVAYRYCIAFNCTPEYILDTFTRLYSRLELAALGRFYDDQETRATEQSKTCGLQFTINHDMDFLASLPRLLSDLERWQLDALVSYGIDPDLLYDLETETIDEYEREKLHFKNDPVYTDYKNKVSSFVQRGVKKKKENDYKKNLQSNLVSTAETFEEWYEKYMKDIIIIDDWSWEKFLA